MNLSITWGFARPELDKIPTKAKFTQTLWEGVKYALFNASNVPTLGLDLRDIFEGVTFSRK